MIEIDFKVISYWEKDPLTIEFDATRQVSFSKVKIEQLLDWLCNNPGYFQCGYTIDINNQPWNGFFNEEIKENNYLIDHSGGALSFLRAVTELANGNWRIGKTRSNIWQTDGSEMSLECLPDGKLIIEDRAYHLNPIILDWSLFLTKFTQATQYYIACMNKVLNLSTQENKKKIRHIISESEDISILYEKLKTHSKNAR
jgi:hypothetical protein